MIRRHVADEFWLIAQHDHALLSGHLAEQIGGGEFERPAPRAIRGIALHDCGWPLHDDEAPTLNERGQPLDVFESTPLFQKLWPKLLKSYALDAANEAEPDRLAATCDREEAEEFLRKMAAAPLTDAGTDADLVSSTHSSDDVIRFYVHEKSDRPEASGGAMGGGMGGGGGGYFGGAIHSGGGFY